jgi:hypothetical protein
MSTAIVVNKSLPIIFTASAQAEKQKAISMAGAIQSVTNADENMGAVSAQLTLRRLIKAVDDGIAPLIDKANDYKKAVWSARDQFKSELEAELLRVTRLAGDFATLEQARVRAEEQARNDRLSQLERERAAALAQAQSHDQFDAISEEYCKRAAEVEPVQEQARANGQTITQDFEFTVVDIHLLYKCHPNCCKLEPRMSEIRDLLKLGITPKGVVAKPIVKAGVRLAHEPKAIDVETV